MKVVIAHNRYSSAQPSGENTMVDTESRLLAEVGVEVIGFQRSSDEIPSLPPVQKALLPVSPIYAPRAQRELAALLDRERPDVLHLHNPYPLLSPWVVRTAHKHGVPVVQTVHNFRHICSNGLYFRDGHACRDCLGRAFPLPGIVHSCYRGSKAQSAVMATTLTVHRGTWRSVERFIALTPAVAAHLGTLGIRPDQITVKPNSVPDPGPHHETGDGFLFVGRLSGEKGLGLLLDAWRRHPDGTAGQLRIVGDGPLRSLAETAATERDDVTYTGPLPSTEVPAAIRAASVVLSTSTCEDVLPTVVLEALANARPVLATALGGAPYLIDATGEQPAGWAVPPEPAALAEALVPARTAAPTLFATARQRYEQVFTPKVLTGRLLEVYAELSARRPG